LDLGFAIGYDRSIDLCVGAEQWGAGPMFQEDHSTRIQRCIERLRLGDASARDELLGHALERLTRLTRKMLQDFPGVHRLEETDDVLQNAVLRLRRALDEVQPPTAADFFRLAAAQIRRELLDLARRYSGARSRGATPASSTRARRPLEARLDPPDTTRDPDRLAAWTEFHRAAEALPPEERATFDLLFYQGLSQGEAAAVLGVAEITVKRRWRAARMKLVQALGGKLPGL
jgi:RNA polymerase sigma-70 factor (ECF subfamily)